MRSSAPGYTGRCVAASAESEGAEDNGAPADEKVRLATPVVPSGWRAVRGASFGAAYSSAPTVSAPGCATMTNPALISTRPVANRRLFHSSNGALPSACPCCACMSGVRPGPTRPPALPGRRAAQASRGQRRRTQHIVGHTIGHYTRSACARRHWARSSVSAPPSNGAVSRHS